MYYLSVFLNNINYYSSYLSDEMECKLFFFMDYKVLFLKYDFIVQRETYPLNY